MSNDNIYTVYGDLCLDYDLNQYDSLNQDINYNNYPTWLCWTLAIVNALHYCGIVDSQGNVYTQENVDNFVVTDSQLNSYRDPETGALSCYIYK